MPLSCHKSYAAVFVSMSVNILPAWFIFCLRRESQHFNLVSFWTNVRNKACQVFCQFSFLLSGVSFHWCWSSGLMELLWCKPHLCTEDSFFCFEFWKKLHATTFKSFANSTTLAKQNAKHFWANSQYRLLNT